MPQLKRKFPFLLIAVPVFVIFLLLWTITFHDAQSGPSGGSKAVLTEVDFSQDPGLFAAPNEDIIAVFLESPSTEGEENDTGGDGFDVIPYRYNDALEQTFCWQDGNQSAEHYMTLSDGDDNEILTVVANGSCVTRVIEPGDYEMRLYNDGRSDESVAVFIVTEEDSSLISTTTGEALANVATFLDTNSCVGCDLSGVNLNNADLRGVDLSNAVLNDAILADADLNGADLSGAQLVNADLSRANLSGADLQGANLSNAILINADLSDANLFQANLENADTTGADFSGAKLTGTLLVGTKADSGEENRAEDTVSTRAFSCSGDLPAGGTGEDLEVTAGTCTVKAGTFNYGNVNIYSGGKLEFVDEGGETHFWAKSILVENNGSLIAGTDSDAGAFGVNGGTLTIHLYGSESEKTGITCKLKLPDCGIPDTVTINKMDTVNPETCDESTFPNGVKDCFYEYTNPDPETGETGLFGRKVLAVSFGGTLRLFGKKGATYSELDPSDSGKSWVRLTETVGPGKNPTTLKLSRAVNWKAKDRVVLTTTDYLPGHSEQLEITEVVSPTEIKIKVINPFTGVEKPEGVQHVHNGVAYKLDNVPTRLMLDIKVDGKPAAETRAAVALLTRSIRIVSAGNEFNDDNPTCAYDCFPATKTADGTPTADGYYGGHTMIRQGFQEVKIQGVEFYQLGQGGRKGRYPAHLHLVRKTPSGTYLKDNSVHDSMTRWYTLHGTQGVTLARNVGYLSIGHGYYIEDGTETDNKFQSNIGIFARAAIENDQNPRKVPGILAWTQDKADTVRVPFHSDYAQPSVFWIMNGWNEFEYNMAVGAGTCGACYWWIPGSISGPSKKMKWLSYASLQRSEANAGAAPLKKFKGNYCSTAMNSFNSTGDTSPCIGLGTPPNDMHVEPITNPLAKPPPDPIYYPTVKSARIATICDEPDCSNFARCNGTDRIDKCAVTVLDRYTSSFNWAEINFSAIWLRQQWYLVTNSVISDVQFAGLTFVTGGDYTKASSPGGNWLLARNSVFIGETQDNNPYASDVGPFNPDALQCENNATNYCINRHEGIMMPLNNFNNNQRFFNIYDGPSEQDSNAYLNITKTKIGDCPFPNVNQQCNNSKWMYGKVLGLPADFPKMDRCIVPNAAIAWKQSNGFYYPPAFLSNNLFFDDKVDIRHFVIEPLFKAGTRMTDENAVKERYCTWNPTMFANFTSIDRQTILNDLDGSLTGLLAKLPSGEIRETISVNEDPFFNAPVEAVECRSDGTAKTSPYEWVTTAVYPDCDGPCPVNQEGNPYPPPVDWGSDCANENCYGVPMYRQLLTEPESKETDHSKDPVIRLMGMNIWQRSNLTVNNGVYYIDTTVSRDKQLNSLPPPPAQPDPNNPLAKGKDSRNLNVFKGGQKYYFYFVFAKSNLAQTYQMFVGKNATFTEQDNVKLVTTELKTKQLEFNEGAAWPSSWTRDYDSTTGILTVKIDLNVFKEKFDSAKAASCRPSSFCVPETKGSSNCVCSTTLDEDLYKLCNKEINGRTVCSWANERVDCPEGGCLGFSVMFPPENEFKAENQGADRKSDGGERPNPVCFTKKDHPEFNVGWEFAPIIRQTTGCFKPPVKLLQFCDDVGSAVDTDGDGVNDGVDVDSDNDGIPDSIETAANGTNSLTSARLIIPADPDGDGIPNELDLDSDGDGLTDYFEAGGTDDANGDGRADNFTDADMDGLNDAYEPSQGGTALPLPDSDGDGVPDFLDSVDNSSSSCAIAGRGGVKGDLAGLLVYALIPAAVVFRRKLGKKRNK